MKKCDLHIHSVFSDSDATIEDIFNKARKSGLFSLAITDHDTVEGLGEARLMSKIYNIELVEAIELSAQEENIEVHILGYFIESQNEKLKSALLGVKKLRRERFLLMIEKLNSLGIGVDREEILLKVKKAVPSRLHLALYLVEKGLVYSLQEAFRKYFSVGKPAYVSRFKYSVKEAIQLIKDCRGIAFLAHPHFLPQDSWIERFSSFGLNGLEVVYPHFLPKRASFYKNIAAKYGLLMSGGSDSHGSYKEFTQIGGVTIPYEWVEKMKARRFSQG